MSWESIIKNATREGEQYYKEYLASMYDWFETCMGIIREELDRLEGVLADVNSRVADAERFGFMNVIEEARRKGAVVRQLIYKALDDVKDTEKVVRDLEEFYPIFGTIQDNIDNIKKRLGDFKSARQGGLSMGRKFLKDKLGRKPGDGNFLVNLKKDGSMKFFNVSFTAIDSDDDILTKMGSSQSAMKLNFTKTFG